MSLSECITGLIADGAIPKAQGQKAEGIYNRHFNELKSRMGMMAAAEEASVRTIKQMRAEAARRKQLTLAHVLKQDEVLATLKSFGNGDGTGPIDPKAGAALFAKDLRASYSSVESKMAAVRGQAHAMMDRILQTFSANIVGQVRNAAELRDVVRELFGHDTGNLAAREMAESWNQTAEMLRQRFNALGGDIGKLDRWGLPQRHDWKLVRDAGLDPWRNFVRERLDRGKMIDRTTGAPFTDEALDVALEETFNRIRSSGWVDREAGAGGMGALANRMREERFLIFKDGEAWDDYAANFGSGNAYDAMVHHVDRMAQSIAMMDVLGPNPDAMVRFVKGALEKSAAEDVAPGAEGVQAARAAGKLIDDLYAELTGASREPRSERMALGFSSLRALQTAAKLGGAYLSATTDFGFSMMTRAINGLPVKGMLRDYVKLMRPGAGGLDGDHAMMIRRGLIADEAASLTAGQSRYLSEELTGEIPRRLASGVLRLSLLSRHTQVMRWMHGMETLATFTEQIGKAMDDLDPALAQALNRYGIDAARWDRLRAAPLDTDRGAEWINPRNTGDDDLADRFFEMIATETDFAVPTADLRTRALMNSKLERGTLIGEIGRSALLFKSFGISVMMRQSHRIMQMAGPDAARYAGGLLISTTLLGGLSLLLKDMAAGRDPRETNDMPFWENGEPTWDPGFWGAAVLQGGGLGIFGDLIKSQENRLGGGLAETLAGPLAQTIDNLIATPLSAKEGRGAWQLVRGLKQEMPGQSLWYARLAFDRMVTDQIQEAIDPDYAAAWQRMDRWAAEQGSPGQWWDQGELTPDRAPDLMTIFDAAPATEPSYGETIQ